MTQKLSGILLNYYYYFCLIGLFLGYVLGRCDIDIAFLGQGLACWTFFGSGSSLKDFFGSNNFASFAHPCH